MTFFLVLLPLLIIFYLPSLPLSCFLSFSFSCSLPLLIPPPASRSPYAVSLYFSPTLPLTLPPCSSPTSSSPHPLSPLLVPPSSLTPSPPLVFIQRSVWPKKVCQYCAAICGVGGRSEGRGEGGDQCWCFLGTKFQFAVFCNHLVVSTRWSTCFYTMYIC